jgi:hypothetical protein
MKLARWREVVTVRITSVNFNSGWSQRTRISKGIRPCREVRRSGWAVFQEVSGWHVGYKSAVLGSEAVH